MSVVRRMFHGGPLGEARVVDARIRVTDTVASDLAGAVVPAGGRVLDVADDASVTFAPSWARTARAAERVVSTLA